MDLDSAQDTGSILALLTPRQRTCMEGVKRGLSSKQIARELGISHRTVEVHIAAALEKMGIGNRYAAMALMHNEDGLASGDRGAFALPDASPSEALHVEEAPPPPAEPSQPLHEGTFAFLPPLGGAYNRAPHSVRRVWIMRIALLALMLTGAAIVSIIGLVKLAKAL